MPSSNDYLILAERDRRYAEFGERGFPDDFDVGNSAYLMEQAVEKLLKGLILMYGETAAFTHDIGKLRNHAIKLGIEVPEDLEFVADSLTLWGTKVRYDPSVTVSETLYKKAVSVYEALHEKLVFEIAQVQETDEDETEAEETGIKME